MEVGHMCLHNAVWSSPCTLLRTLPQLPLQPSASARHNQVGVPAHVLDACTPGLAASQSYHSTVQIVHCLQLRCVAC